jgi:hypothetical protein
MTSPDEPIGGSLAQTASESQEESIRREREAVGDRPDTGDVVTPDHSQSAPAADEQQDARDRRLDSLPPGPAGPRAAPAPTRRPVSSRRSFHRRAARLAQR